MKPRQFETKETNSTEMKASKNGVIVAYASTFNNVDSTGDKIIQGAFTKTIQERGNRVKVLLNHNSFGLPVGKPQSLIQDNTGLEAATKMSDIQLGRDIYTLAEEEALDSLSIGFYALNFHYDKESTDKDTDIPNRVITEIKLMEYSFVTFPANELAIITGVKNAEDLERQIKQWTKIYDVGLKSGRVLSKENASRILVALKSLQDIVESAGLSTDDSKSEPKSTHEDQGLLELLKSEADRLKVSGEEAIYNELLAYSRTILE